MNAGRGNEPLWVSTRMETTKGDYTYTAFLSKRGWVLQRRPTNGPNIPPVITTLGEDDVWHGMMVEDYTPMTHTLKHLQQWLKWSSGPTGKKKHKLTPPPRSIT